MMVHPQVGPGADVTMTPFGVFPPQLQPYAQPFDQNHDPYATLSLGQQHSRPYAPPNKVPQWTADNSTSDRNLPSNGLGLGSLVDAGLGAQIGGQTQLYWDNLIDGQSLRVHSGDWSLIVQESSLIHSIVPRATEIVISVISADHTQPSSEEQNLDNIVPTFDSHHHRYIQ